MVPRADGSNPPSWPAAGLERGALVGGAIAAVNNHLLCSWTMAVLQRRNAFAAHTGTTLV